MAWSIPFQHSTELESLELLLNSPVASYGGADCTRAVPRTVSKAAASSLRLAPTGCFAAFAGEAASCRLAVATVT